jgi:hypothetical protein
MKNCLLSLLLIVGTTLTLAAQKRSAAATKPNPSVPLQRLSSAPLRNATTNSASEASAADGITPTISTVTISPDTVTDLRLKPLYAATIRMPEAVSSVVVGAPNLFAAEHSEHEPELVIVKPITRNPAASNLLIATRSGQEVSLRLISGGAATASDPVDFVLIYRPRRSFLIGESEIQPPATISRKAVPPSLYELAYQEQIHIASPAWTTSKQQPALALSLGMVAGDGDDMVVAFSALNRSGKWIEILAPQIELASLRMNQSPDKAGEKKSTGKVLADRVAIKEFQLTTRKLAPGARADGVIRFKRPSFKQDQERLQLALATADAVNRPLLISLPFTAPLPQTSLAAKE